MSGTNKRLNRGFRTISKTIGFILVISILLLSLGITTVTATPDDSLTVNTSAYSEGDGDTYSFPYVLTQDTVLEWNLQSDASDTYFDFIVFDDIENPFTSSIVEVFDKTSHSGTITIPRAGIWFLHVRHSRFHGNYYLHVTGWITQTGTLRPSTTTPPTTTDTYPTNTPTSSQFPDSSSMFLVILIGVAVIFTLAALGYIWKKCT